MVEPDHLEIPSGLRGVAAASRLHALVAVECLGLSVAISIADRCGGQVGFASGLTSPRDRC